MGVESLAAHLQSPLARGHTPPGSVTGAAGGAACGDLIRVSLRVAPGTADGQIADAGFDASGCGSAVAAGSAAIALVRGRPLLDAARVGAEQIAAELGGLSAAKRHAAELAADALARALGQALRTQAQLAPSRSRALVAMSGGVDSAVAALLVAEGADETVAVTLELWADAENDGERSCCSAQAVRSARELAHGLGMAHFSIDLREEFRAGVVEPWLAEHAAGLTPNPCVRCNGRVRLDAMLELADRLGAATLATGHYARVRDGLLRVAADERKDQSYALAALAPASLARMRFPLGELDKQQVRERAERAALAVAHRPDSQDLCFLAGTSTRAFLARHGGLGERPGKVVHDDGRVLGEHGGVHTVTIGQRRGLGIGGAQGGAPLYVLDADAGSRVVTVGPRERLRSGRIGVRDVTLHRNGECVDAVKVRYRGRRVSCRVQGEPGPGEHACLEVLTDVPQERTAPGQMACLYAGEQIVGYGTIAS